MVDRSIVAICQFGGEFTSNIDGTMCYAGGEAHAIDISRDMPFDDLKAEISGMFSIDASSMSIKYFLPNNRHTLITISSDKDLRRMVDFSSNASAAEIYVLNKVDNRVIKSTVADSGTSVVATVETAQGAKRKKPASGGRLNKCKMHAPDSSGPSDPAYVALGYLNSVKDKWQTAAEKVDNRLHVVDLRTPGNLAMPVTASNVDLMPTTADNVDERTVAESMPLVASPGNVKDVEPFNPDTLVDGLVIEVGQEFDNVRDFRARLCKYAITKGFVYKFVKNETHRVTVRCSEDSCPWRIHASEMARGQKFVVKKMNGSHTCGGASGRDGNRRATRQWLTGIIKEKLHRSPQCKPKEIVRELFEDYGVNVTYSQVWRGREVAQKELYTTFEEAYRLLPWFCEKILETNPGSATILSSVYESKDRRFFVAFYASLHGFEHGCRPLLFLDRIPLKANIQSKLLAAAAVDGDDVVFPVAFCVVEDESYSTWSWFLSQLRDALPRTRAITFVSGRQRGLEEAVPQAFVDGFHSFCLHHLVEDLKGELKKGPWSPQVKDSMINDFTRAAQACTAEEFDSCIENVNNTSTDVAEWVLASKPENWSDAFFKGARYDHLSVDIADSFSGWIPAKHESSVVQMVESIRGRLAEVMYSRREASEEWLGVLTPSMDRKLQKEMEKARKLSVLCSSETVYEVRGNTIYVVDIGTCECTCRRWQISGLPCMHAAAVFNRVGRSAYDYCLQYFRVESYRLAYSEPILPMPGVEGVDFSNMESLYPPPPARSPPGRKKRKRANNPNKTATAMRLCSRCKMSGHNKATCEAIL